MMKLSFLTAKFSIFLLIIYISINSTCKGPEEFEPPVDSLIPAPDPPSLLTPKDGKVFYWEPPAILYILLEWDSVQGAEIYERELIIDTFPTYVMTKNTFYVLAIGIVLGTGKYYWRIRAGSPAWIGGYTDWSEQRNFEVCLDTSPPKQLNPPDDTIFWLNN